MFEWTWDSIAAECTNFIGPAGKRILAQIETHSNNILGYGYVQGQPKF